VPLLVALMAATFSAYLVVKGLRHVWKPGFPAVATITILVFALVYLVAKPWVHSQSAGMENRNQALRKLFHLPLICSAALLSFAHGSNDVANAVGPLAAILNSAQSGALASQVGVPFWVMLIGAVGISLGLFLFGPRIVRIVGEKITKMNPMRAFCVALSAAVTVLVASQLGLPVSTTHIVVGAVFGVGFFREYYTTHSRRRRNYIRTHKPYAHARSPLPATPDELRRRKLVRRSPLPWHHSGLGDHRSLCRRSCGADILLCGFYALTIDGAVVNGLLWLISNLSDDVLNLTDRSGCTPGETRLHVTDLGHAEGMTPATVMSAIGT